MTQRLFLLKGSFTIEHNYPIKGPRYIDTLIVKADTEEDAVAHAKNMVEKHSMFYVMSCIPVLYAPSASD